VIRATSTRRGVLQNAALAAAGSMLQGCFLHHDKTVIRTGYLTMPGIDPALNPLTIDSHCHIFNGSDLQVREFIARVVVTEKGIVAAVVEALSELLQLMIWDSAPNGDGEFELLSKLIALTSEDAGILIEQRRQEGYKNARSAVLKTRGQAKLAPAKAANEPIGLAPDSLSSPLGQTVLKAPASLKGLMQPAPTKDDVLQQIYASFEPTSYEEHLQKHTSDMQQLRNFDLLMKGQNQTKAGTPQLGAKADTGIATLGVVKYLSEGFQYRIVGVQDYLDTFTKPAKRSVDLMVPSMVDYDWWLAQGAPTKTPLTVTPKSSKHKSQLQVMEQISILTRGQVHGFAPFDPLREVAYHAHKGAAWSSLEFVQDAVTNHGCIGIKLYPPMGFAPYGNAEKGNDFWKGNKLPDWLSSEISYDDGKPALGLGKRMDDALDALYQWCSDERNQVPILAHSNETNGTTEQFRELVSASYWSKALERYPNLRVSFGHLGDLSGALNDSEIPKTAESYIRLFQSNRHTYGDSGFDAEILKQKKMLEERYVSAYADQSTPGNRLLAERLMYGTDWNLLMTNGDIDSYLRSFVELFEGLPNSSATIAGHSIKDRFFGWNAVDFLGLKKGQPTRSRLEVFYEKNDVDYKTTPPVWMVKVDSHQ
jgi:predicted TIM-barrel fold metal-dependent hydrolase